MRNRIVCIALTAAAIAALGAVAWSYTSTDRPDCPGKIVCPLTGELVCKDRCPLANAGDATNDRAPDAVSAAASAAAPADSRPACCRGAD